ncbi:MAG TPA: hypothetical protein GX506_01610 [Firmicutes bacterium]|nr:hypothetical protein [Bacillota bacterium]
MSGWLWGVGPTAGAGAIRTYIMLGLAIGIVVAGLALAPEVSACVGARALAMGGAFVAVADDAEAVYWNPAGLGRSQTHELTFTHTINNRGVFNYDEFVALTMPLGANGAGGVSWIRESTRAGFEGDWVAFSYGLRAGGNLSLGTTLRYEQYGLVSPGGSILGGVRWALDLGVIYSIPPSLSVGALLQDINGSPIYWEDGLVSWVAPNLRPGVSYRFESGTILAVDIYDLTREIPGQRTLRIGYETHLGRMALRFGYYGLGSGRGAPTAGIGYSGGRVRLDYAFLGRGLSPGDPGLGGTHQLGVSVTL